MGDVVASHSVGQDVWEEFDASATVTGGGKVSFGLMNNEASYSNVDAKEGANPPVLEVVAVSHNGDKDEDGISNAWEFDYFGGVTNAVATVDSDGDGFHNLAEYIAGTNPTNGASLPTVSYTNSGTGFVIIWEPVSNRVYDILHSFSVTNSYTNIVSDLVFPQSAYTDSAHSAESSGFYKVNVRMP